MDWFRFHFVCLVIMLQGINQTNNVSGSELNNALDMAAGNIIVSNNPGESNSSELQINDSCSEIDFAFGKLDCYMALARDTNDPSFCEKGYVDDGSDPYKFSRDTLEYGPGLFTLVTRERKKCYNDIAKNTNNSKICEGIFPYDIYSKDVVKCKLQIGTNTEELCDSMRDYDAQQDCYKTYYICQKIVDGSCGQRPICVRTTQDKCYNHEAWKNEDPSICENTSNEDAYAFCIKSMG